MSISARKSRRSSTSPGEPASSSPPRKNASRPRWTNPKGRSPASADTPAFYRAQDGFTLPSGYERFALPALEALTTGPPLALTECPGNDDLKRYGFDALRWCPVGDADGLAAQILVWLDAVAKLNNHRGIGVEKLDARDAWEQVVHCYATG